VRLFIDSWRWEGVPFLIRAGKRLPVTSTTVTVEFKRPPRETFGETVPISSNHLRLRLSPEVLIGLGVRVKVPSERMEGKDVELIVCQNEGDALAPYERLLGDALAGDQTLFGTQARVEEQWRVVEPLLRGGAPPTIYEPGSWGPPEAGALVPPGTAWHDPRASERGRCAPGAGEDADARPGANAP
jgi:glucose-6-phosphate 1-dehydrogenase